MLDRPNSQPEPSPLPNGKQPPPRGIGGTERPVKRRLRTPDRLDLAKWPPDDDDLPGGAPGGGGAVPPAPTGGGGGGADFGDGDFKKGRFNPVTIIVALLIVAGGAAALFFGIKQGQEKMTVEQVVKEKKNIFVLPVKDQIPRWRTWAANPNEWALQQEALIQLAYAEDPEGVTHAIKALEQPDHRVKGVAAQVLAYYGSPKGDAGKAALLAALKEADDSDRPQLVWALVMLKEPQVFKDAMDQYRKGFLSKVERLGGGTAFDPERLASLVSLDEFAKLAADPSPSVRQLVATLLSRDANPKWTQTLITLVKDPDSEVGREAATGLGKIGDETARAPLLSALSSSSKENRQKFLEALRDGIGGEGLVLALASVKKDPAETEWFQTKQLMEMMKDVADPRVGDSLVKWLEGSPKPTLHWQGEAGTRLAEVGDIRAAKYLGERMRVDPSKLYAQERFWEADEGGHLSRTDLPRVVASRMLADLAMIHTDKKDELKAAAEDGVLFWIKDRPQPHANGLRFLSAVQSEKVKNDLRDWAFPKDPLPKEGAQPPFPTAFETAQSALRYVGMMKDEPTFPKLLEQFKRKPDKKMDITQEALNGAGLAMLGMALRAVAYGAAQGLGQWGDGKASKPLMELIEDESWHEEARQAACDALAWCADDKTMSEVAKKAKEYGAKKEPRKQLIGACYASTLSLKPVPSISGELADLLTPDLDIGLRMAYARAIGIGGFDQGTEAKLFEKLQNPEIRNAAALALILGGSGETAARTVAMYGDFGPDALNDLKDHYFRAFGYWSDEDFKRGNIYRWVANAEAIARIKVADVPQEWSRQRLQSQFDNLKFDNGPHSETRVVLRYRLWQDAKNGDAARKKGAIQTLKFMKERGVLMALRQEQGETGEMAKRAFFEIMNPKAIVAEDLSKLQPKDKGAKEQ
ncbi:HEAT repeat domain-containing protein [Polyangium sp. 15x6]|uniref:HEAT repeat domain-containing protein n=1 Tax=Polyangium sp. 15x6 TaxID=3042687 RepID=UPI00249BEB53|nr:HEAT repeat domain-containing protein [Polyangium sp. 15x6]MDI3285019.1 HEAT repeat domain-containing protein [Polyangium sp. 15x6]